MICPVLCLSATEEEDFPWHCVYNNCAWWIHTEERCSVNKLALDTGMIKAFMEIFIKEYKKSQGL